MYKLYPGYQDIPGILCVFIFRFLCYNLKKECVNNLVLCIYNFIKCVYFVRTSQSVGSRFNNKFLDFKCKKIQI